MRNILIFILLAITINLGNNVSAQEKITRFRFAGYKVIFIPSDVFRIEIDHPEWGNQDTKGNLFTLTIKDAKGKMPKDTVRIYTDSVRSINMDYSELVMDKQMGADSLTVSIGSSHGTVYVEANHLKVHAKAGSHITLRGTAQSLECQSKGHSYIDQSQFHQKK